MSKAFFTPYFNEPLDCWDTSNVTDMIGRFYGAKFFVLGTRNSTRGMTLQTCSWTPTALILKIQLQTIGAKIAIDVVYSSDLSSSDGVISVVDKAVHANEVICPVSPASNRIIVVGGLVP